MTYLKNFGLFWYDFIIGDDWRIAATVVVALALTSLLVHTGNVGWWVLPLAVVASLGRASGRLHTQAHTAWPARLHLDRLRAGADVSPQLRPQRIHSGRAP